MFVQREAYLHNINAEFLLRLKLNVTSFKNNRFHNILCGRLYRYHAFMSVFLQINTSHAFPIEGFMFLLIYNVLLRETLIWNLILHMTSVGNATFKSFVLFFIIQCDNGHNINKLG